MSEGMNLAEAMEMRREAREAALGALREAVRLAETWIGADNVYGLVEAQLYSKDQAEEEC